MPGLAGTQGQEDCGPAGEQKVSQTGCRGSGPREGQAVPGPHDGTGWGVGGTQPGEPPLPDLPCLSQNQNTFLLSLDQSTILAGAPTVFKHC